MSYVRVRGLVTLAQDSLYKPPWILIIACGCAAVIASQTVVYAHVEHTSRTEFASTLQI